MLNLILGLPNLFDFELYTFLGVACLAGLRRVDFRVGAFRLIRLAHLQVSFVVFYFFLFHLQAYFVPPFRYLSQPLLDRVETLML